MMHEVCELKSRYGVPFTTHASENQTEIEVVRERYGKTPVELLASYDLLDSGTVLAHCVKLDDREIEMLSTSGTSVAHCPESNLKLGSGIARIADMVEAGVNVCVGTDGTASNNDLDLWGEVRTAALLQKGLTTLQALEMATINGAKAYGIDRELGSLEPGKRADIAIVDFDKSHLTPCYDVYAHLVYAVDRADVDTVLIDGRIHMENSEIITVDENAIKARVRAIGKEIA
jgi:5-methylthioadenosine/S-adenosylhomocysteine deaminase